MKEGKTSSFRGYQAAVAAEFECRRDKRTDARIQWNATYAHLARGLAGPHQPTIQHQTATELDGLRVCATNGDGTAGSEELAACAPIRRTPA